MKELRIKLSNLSGVTDKVSWNFVVKPFLLKKGFDLTKPIIPDFDIKTLEWVYYQED